MILLKFQPPYPGGDDWLIPFVKPPSLCFYTVNHDASHSATVSWVGNADDIALSLRLQRSAPKNAGSFVKQWRRRTVAGFSGGVVCRS